MKNRSLFVGIILGITANFFGFLLARLIFIGSFPLINLTNVVTQSHHDGLLTKLISLGAFLNLLLFFFFIKKNKEGQTHKILS